jgi:hypothetical protein
MHVNRRGVGWFPPIGINRQLRDASPPVTKDQHGAVLSAQENPAIRGNHLFLWEFGFLREFSERDQPIDRGQASRSGKRLSVEAIEVTGGAWQTTSS